MLHTGKGKDTSDIAKSIAKLPSIIRVAVMQISGASNIGRPRILSLMLPQMGKGWVLYFVGHKS